MFLSTVRINDLSSMAGRLHLEKFSSVEFESWRVLKYSSRSIRSELISQLRWNLLRVIISLD